jgi:hypothetical protein
VYVLFELLYAGRVFAGVLWVELADLCVILCCVFKAEEVDLLSVVPD